MWQHGPEDDADEIWLQEAIPSSALLPDAVQPGHELVALLGNEVGVRNDRSIIDLIHTSSIYHQLFTFEKSRRRDRFNTKENSCDAGMEG